MPPGLASVLSKRRCQICLPGGDVDAEEIVGDARDDGEFTGALRRGDALGDERREQVVHCARRAVQLDLPQQRRLSDVGGREDFLVAHPAGPRLVDTLGQEVGGQAGTACRRDDECNTCHCCAGSPQDLNHDAHHCSETQTRTSRSREKTLSRSAKSMGDRPAGVFSDGRNVFHRSNPLSIGLAGVPSCFAVRNDWTGFRTGVVSCG